MRQRCSQLTAKGEPCQAWAMRGGERCQAHAGLVGRKTLLTPATADHLVAMIRAGTYLPVALRAAGVARRTYVEWMTRSRSGKPSDALYRDLRERVEQAKAEAEVRLVAEITRASRDSWQAAAWLLERLAPTRYGKPSVRIRTEAPPEPVVEEELPPASDDPFAEVDELAERRRGRVG